MENSLPALRWGVIGIIAGLLQDKPVLTNSGTGLISSWFAKDLVLIREEAKAHHIIQAIGSSSVEKGRSFVLAHIPQYKPTVYGSYEAVYEDPLVDIVYIGTPHLFHRQNCLDAIRCGKHVLSEKPLSLNCQEAEDVFNAARAKGVFVMEAVWTRFTPLFSRLMKMVHEDKTIGQVHRVFCDFGLPLNLDALPDHSRLKNPRLGAGSLLDIGLYSLTWGLVLLDDKIGNSAAQPEVFSAQLVRDDGVEVCTSIILQYSNKARHGILTSTLLAKTDRVFARIEGSKGTIKIEGVAPSAPSKFTVILNGQEEQVYEFPKAGMGFYYEADAVALDIAAGRRENATMPWDETLRVMRVLDGIRKRGGAEFPQDSVAGDN